MAPAAAGGESCSCIERIAASATKRRRAREAEKLAVEELHDAILDATDAPTCAHSRRELREAAGLTDGGLQNVIAGAGRRLSA